jgi:hypothetical protein
MNTLVRTDRIKLLATAINNTALCIRDWRFHHAALGDKSCKVVIAHPNRSLCDAVFCCELTLQLKR